VAFEDAVGVADVRVEEVDDRVLVAGRDQIAFFVVVECIDAAVYYVQVCPV